MQDRVTLPKWLDDLIFEQLGAKYCRSNADMTVIDWDRKDVLNYLGTYFPRSYAESYCIFSEFFRTYPQQFAEKEELSVFDFGCGTGGEIIGLFTVLNEYCPNLKKVRLVALDGNQEALLQCEEILSKMKTNMLFEIGINPVHLHVSVYKLQVLDEIMTETFDIIITFKAICEFVTKKQFEERNPYGHLARFLIPKLKNDGLILVEDVSTYNDTSQEWLPRMMDKGLKEAGCSIVKQNKGYNQSYYITHSRMLNDRSKVAWRMIKR